MQGYKFCSPVLAGAALMMALLSPVSAAQSDCDGEWSLEVKSASLSGVDKQRGDAWLPATLYVDRSLSRCATALQIAQPQGGQLRLTGPRENADYHITNGSRQALAQRRQDEHLLLLTGKAAYDLWLHIPAADTLAPGSYSGMLDLRLLVANGKPLTQLHPFTYQVEPYVRARLAGMGDAWLQPSGTSVRLHLGDLTQKNRRELPVYMESNGFVIMALSSHNKGRLVNVSNKQNSVPYRLMFGGQALSLTDETTVDVGNRPFRSNKVILSFENAPQPYARAGLYEDVVTVSLFAR